MRIVVISDLHVGSGPLDDCDAQLETALIDFFTEMSGSTEAVELVINGDFIDFAQAEPWDSKDLEGRTVDGIPLCFSEEQSVEKLRSVLRAHGSIFTSLGEALRSPAINRITILPGNHDVDLFWPKVRAEFYNQLNPSKVTAVGDKLFFCLEQSYRPAHFPDLWVEHGHQHDDCNSFEVKGVQYWSEARPPIFCDVKGTQRLLECVGTRFMLKFMNRLDALYPFVDNVKPFSKFVKMFLVSQVASEFGPLKAVTAYWGLAKFMAGRLFKEPRDILSADENPEQLAKGFSRIISDLTKQQAGVLI